MNKIKEIWNKIFNFLSPYLKTYKIFKFLTSKTFLFIIVLVVFILLGRSCARHKEQQRITNIYEQNILALVDSLKVEVTKSRRQQTTIASYIADIEELEDLNIGLFEEVEEQKGNVVSLNQMVFQLEQQSDDFKEHINHLESIINQPVQLNDSTYKLTWEKRYDWDNVNYDIYKGQTIVGLTTFGLKHYDTDITYRLSQADLTFGQTVENNQLRIFVKTNYPGFTAKSLEGVLIDPNTNSYIQGLIKKKKWLPNTFSVGIGPSFGYDILSTKIYLGIGVNISYNLLQW